MVSPRVMLYNTAMRFVIKLNYLYKKKLYDQTFLISILLTFASNKLLINNKTI